MANVVKKHSISFELAQKMVAEALAKAKEIGVTENVAILDDGGNLKAEDLDTPAVHRIFAKQLLAFHETKPTSYAVPLQVLRIGDAYLCGIPGEPVVEIGLELKKSIEKGTVVPVALAGGYFGYIPLEECFKRGGYEIKQGINNCLSQKASGIIVKSIKDMVIGLTGREAV